LVEAVHDSVKGRARYRVEGLYRSDDLKEYLEEGLPKKAGIAFASASILTGNVLVLYAPEFEPSHVAAQLLELLAERRHNGNGGGALSAALELSRRPAPVRKHRRGDTTERPGTRGASRRSVRKQIIHGEQQVPEPWHLRRADEVLDFFGCDRETGLSTDGQQEKLKRFGPNILPESVPRSGWSILAEQFMSFPVALLGAAAAISVATGGLADAIVIMSVVGINAVIGYATESGSERTIHSLKNLVRPSALVLRDGQVCSVGVEAVVPGDLLVLRPGSYVAADARLIEAQYLSIDESALTGESMPAGKTADALDDADLPLADRINMVFMGTLVTGGQGLAVVTATGGFTQMGQIQTMVGEARAPSTPMEQQLDHMGTQLALISGAVCGGVFFIGLMRGYGFLRMLKSSISLAVAAVPEGLPAVATTTLALGIRNMRRQNVLVRRLEAIETLGSVQTICLDKTGTLTLNRMSVTEVFVGMEGMRVRDGKFSGEAGYTESHSKAHRGGDDEPTQAYTSVRQGERRGANKNGAKKATRYRNPYLCEELLKLLHVSVLCNESEVFGSEGQVSFSGSSTENALLNMALTAGVSIVRLRQSFPLLKMVHRSETRNMMLTIHATAEGPAKIVAVKGSPPELLALCTWHIKDGAKLPLLEEDREAILAANEEMAGRALRVLGCAYAMAENGVSLGDNGDIEINDLMWLGIVGMKDPVRPGVKQLIGEFHGAGIDTIMITGDQSATAYAVGKELNLSAGKDLEILDSRHLSDMPPDVLKALSKSLHVFARVSPAHKLQIVRVLQEAGRVVAMTGDGINDGPALKAAGIGIAMGHTGTDVAREVADVVLEDDNLETMVVAISQGRTIYNNIRKSVHFLLSTNMSEIIVMFTCISAGLGEPLTAMQLLWINLISDIFPGLALALEAPEPDVLSRPPRDPKEQILQPAALKKMVRESAVISAGSLGAFGYGVLRYGRGPQANTLAFLSLTVGQLLHALSCRSETKTIFDRGKLPPNRYLTGALVGSFALQGVAMVTPGMRRLLSISPLGVVDGLVAAGGAVLPLLANEAIKKTTRGAP
jgi:Ca2+-transporting ATPase